ncbi:methyltransferase domain-containing protein [Myxosarcina sp. GI1]|uniref:methyltransferase domain-containing protein n=1 Tax=Myxosarcina sp. GI1 TaxID=1541065 RepID=UPI00056AA66D|nr:methyltransferase domain-containing protein [Myxosarcina sp. GI1]
MSENKYVFTDTQLNSELERLRLLEKVCDPLSKRLILATGITTGWQCLEVGAGAGSIVRSMSEIVGSSGRVIAVDIDTRFIEDISLPNVEIIRDDIRNPNLSLTKNSFDLIHVRNVLIHLADFRVALSRILNLLKPGGWLVVEEPDFSATRAIYGNKQDCQAVDRVNQAIRQMFSDRDLNYSLGVLLPSMFQQLGLQIHTVENDVPIVNGGSNVATMMNMSATQLREKYLATGKASEEDIKNYCQFAEDSSFWAIYVATVGVVGQH